MDELVDGQLVGSRLNNNKNTSTSPLHQVIMLCAPVWENSNAEFIKFRWVFENTICSQLGKGSIEKSIFF